MVGIRLPHGLQQQPGLLDVVDVSSMTWDHGLEVREVALGVDHGLAGHRVAGLLQLEVHQGVSGLADLPEVKVSRGGQHPEVGLCPGDLGISNLL